MRLTILRSLLPCEHPDIWLLCFWAPRGCTQLSRRLGVCVAGVSGVSLASVTDGGEYLGLGTILEAVSKGWGLQILEQFRPQSVSTGWVFPQANPR